mmetsp:Transcript_25512/g.22518  ORF Transcript_25512/g.22518 Transcript_25512/m.22518 type:complete len:137 (-) Transcript_25512:933-1343(-)
MVCPCETPEGAPIGLVKNMTLMTYVSVGVPTRNINTKLKSLMIEELTRDSTPASVFSKTKIFVNGGWVGVCENPEEVINILKQIRRETDNKEIKEISIVRDVSNKEIRIYTDSGRVQRPLFIVENGKLKLKPHHIV